MADKSVVMLRLKIDQPDVERLATLGKLCRLGRNAAVEDWLLRQRGKPPSPKQAAIPAARTVNGIVRQAAEKSESTKLYHAVTAAAPALDTHVAAKIAGQINSYLAAKVDWRRGQDDSGKRRRRRDAILAYEDRPPFSSHLNIEVPCKTATVTFLEALTLSYKAERGVTDTVTIRTGSLTAGQKLLIRRAISGELKMPDSTIVLRDGNWYWIVPIMVPVEAVDSELCADLWPQIPDDEPDRVQQRPFRLVMPDGRKRYVGDGRYLEGQTRRLLVLIKDIGWRYRQRNGAGHGRQKVDDSVSRRRTQLRNVTAEVRRRAIADVVRYCQQDRVGTLIWHDPSLPLRDKCWWAANKLEWDWTRFASDLSNAAARVGIVVVTEKFKFSEWKDKNEQSEDTL